MSPEDAPEVCPHWSDGKHGCIRFYKRPWRRMFRKRIVTWCIRCDGEVVAGRTNLDPWSLS